MRLEPPGDSVLGHRALWLSSRKQPWGVEHAAALAYSTLYSTVPSHEGAQETAHTRSGVSEGVALRLTCESVWYGDRDTDNLSSVTTGTDRIRMRYEGLRNRGDRLWAGR